jgi:hypothetical protein
MRAVDTNVLVRLLVRDNTAQVQVAELFVAPGASDCLVIETTRKAGHLPLGARAPGAAGHLRLLLAFRISPA